MLRVDTYGQQVLATTGEIQPTDPLPVEAFEHGERLLGHGVPDADGGHLADLPRGDHVLVLGVLVDCQADDVIIVLQVERLVT